MKVRTARSKESKRVHKVLQKTKMLLEDGSGSNIDPSVWLNDNLPTFQISFVCIKSRSRAATNEP